jgi:hypothetical protein
MGAGHSGSTILGVTLGNCADFFYAGEIEEWLPSSGAPSWADRERAGFWGEIAARVDGSGLYGSIATRCIERSSALLRVDRWATRRRLLPRYRQVSEELLQAIAQTAGAEYVVDTSHFPLRARELGKLAGLEVYILFLVRDPHGVVDSNLRELKPHEVAERRLRTFVLNMNLWFTLLVSIAVFVRHPRNRRLFVRHEAFVEDPEGVLGEILRGVGSDAALPDLGALRIGAPIQGNRLIHTETIALKRRAAHSEHRSPLTTLLALPWAPVLDAMRPAARARSAGGR